MTPLDLARLILLSAIWGSSFIFMKILAPVLGPSATACLRLLIAGGFLCCYMLWRKQNLGWREELRHYLIIGIVNSALPFYLYSLAALSLPAGYSVILNASSPLWGALFSAFWLQDPLNLRKIIGMILGAIGVSFVSRADHSSLGQAAGAAILACLLAALCYGLAGVYTKKFAKHLKPLPLAAGSQCLAGLCLLPQSLALGFPWPFAPKIWLSLLALALLCSAVAYLLYFSLIASVGPTKALTVTFLMPLFGMLWAYLFLGEHINAGMIFGCAGIIAGTLLVLWPKKAKKLLST